MKRKIALKGKTVEYELVRKKIKNINLHVDMDKTISVSAPTGVPTERIEAFMLSKAERILRALARLDELRATAIAPVRLTDGEKIALLDKEYTVRLAAGKADLTTAKMTENEIIIAVYDADDYESKKAVFDKLIRRYAENNLKSMLERLFEPYARLGTPMPEIKFRKAVTQYGNCRTDGKIITLNPVIIFAPSKCAEYVIIHEITHIYHPNHSKAFYEALAKRLPDFHEREKAIQQCLAAYIRQFKINVWRSE